LAQASSEGFGSPGGSDARARLRLHGLTLALAFLAWGLEPELLMAQALVLVLTAAGLLVLVRRHLGLSQGVVLACLIWIGASSQSCLRHVLPPERQPPDPAAVVAERLQERVFALEERLAAWGRTAAAQQPVRQTLREYAAQALPQGQARRQLFEALPQLRVPLQLSHLEAFLGLSIFGPSHELMAWSGSATESYDADLDSLEPQGMTLYVEELSLATLKVFVPIRDGAGPLGSIAVDLTVRKPGAALRNAAVPELVELLEVPDGYEAEFTPKAASPAPEPGASSETVAIRLVEGLSGDPLGYLSVQRLASRMDPLTRAVARVRGLIWLVLQGALLVSGASVWARSLGRASRADSLFLALLLGGSLLVSLFSARELELALSALGLSPEFMFRCALLVSMVLWAAWASLRVSAGASRSSAGRWLAACAAGALGFLLLTGGMDSLVWYVQSTPMDMWSLSGATEVFPRLLGHMALVTLVFFGTFVLAALLESSRFWPAALVLCTAAALAVLRGASPWTSALLSGTSLWLSRQLDERFARMHLRLVPAVLGSVFLAFVLVAAYYPLVESAAFESRVENARQLALQSIRGQGAQPQRLLSSELDRLLREQPLCQDLARKDEEVLSGLGAHYWIESALSEQPGDSGLTVLRYDGTPVSTFSTAVQDYTRPEAEFLAELLSSRRRASRVLRVEGRSIEYLGAPVRCGGVHIGFLVLSLESRDFIEFPSALFEPGEVRLIELRGGQSADPSDPRFLPPVVEDERQVGERSFRVHLLPAPPDRHFEQVALLVRIPTLIRRLYAFLWASIGSAVYLTLVTLVVTTALRLFGPRAPLGSGLVLRFADKIFLGSVAVGVIPALILAPIYRQVVEVRFESNIKDRGAEAAEAARTMILEKGTDTAWSIAERLVDDVGELSPDHARQLSRDPVVSWAIYSPQLVLSDSDSLPPHQLLPVAESLLQEVVALGQPIATFEDSQGQSVLLVVLPLYHSALGERELVGLLSIAQRLFTRETDRVLLKVREIIGHDVELYSPDGYLQASSRWPHLQISSPSRRIHPEAFYYIGVLGAHRHTIIRKQGEQYSTFTTYRPCVDRQGALTGFLAVSVGLSASEALASELRNLSFSVALVAFVGLLLSMLAATLLVHRIVRPIRELMHATSRVAAGDLQVQLQPRGDDEITHLVGAFNAMVGRLQRQRDELAKSHRLAAWAEAARRVAHELKNPLTPILLSTQHLRQMWEEQSPRFGEFFHRCTDTIIEQVKSLQHIATEFSRFARLPAPKLEPGELNEAVQSALSVFDGALPDQVRLMADLHPGGTRCEVDQEGVSRAVVNLVQNAIHAVEDGGSVRVSTEVVEKAEGRYVRLTVADDGVGIAEEMKPRLFEPYFSTKRQGTGLGLAIAKRTFDDHRCQVQVRSEAGQGTTFEIDFPALDGERRERR
jgi:signal transduction histidine kinase